jgi:hypothetical protein
MERSTTVTPSDLEVLLADGSGLRVSIYLPVHPASAQAAQDGIRLKNLLRQAEAGLLERGLRTPEADSLLQEATWLLDDPSFWRSGGRGVALFVSTDGTRVFRLPASFEEIAVVGERFHVKPLLPLLTGDRHYSLLALSGSRVRLFQGTRFGLQDVTPAGMPTSLDETMRYDGLEKQTQVHTAGPAKGAGARHASRFHGHGATERDDKGRILVFFRQVDAAIRGLVSRHGGPLVVAGVDHLRSIYREANSYQGLLDEGVSGSPESMSLERLQELTGQVLHPRFEAQELRAAEHCRERFGTGLCVSDLREVLPAARSGRVDTLFVALDRWRWGTYDATSDEVDLHDSMRPDSEDLLDRATAHTLLRRGVVFAVPAERVPGGDPVAALLRY